MEFPIKETLEDRNSRRKSIGTGSSSHAGGRTRRYLVGIQSSQKSIEEVGDNRPNYLIASTGSCHDFCKYGRKDEQLKSRSPIIPKRSTIVNKEKITKIVALGDRKKTLAINRKMPVPVEPIEGMERVTSLRSKKVEVSKHNSLTGRKVTANALNMAQKCSTSYVKPKPVIMNPSSIREASAGSNGRMKKQDIETVEKTGTIPHAKKVMAKATPTGLVFDEPSASRNISLKARKCRILEPVSSLKGQNRMCESKLNQSIANKVQEKVLHVVKAESEDGYGEGPSIKSSQDLSDKEVLDKEFEYIVNEEHHEIETSKGNHDHKNPRKLKFIRDNRRTYRKKDNDEAINDCNNGSESVVLKHQIVQGKKDGEVLLNKVIEETASKLVESRKSKVKALVGAFETVISLQDVKPSSSS